MIPGIVRRLARGVRRLVPGRGNADLRWWERRAERAGARSVLNRGHAGGEAVQLDEWQKGILFPILRRHLRGDEGLLLDFGCGPGRFTPELAELIGGRAVGVDPIHSLLALAPPRANVEYRLLRDGKIPLENESVDGVWICLVLMCITDPTALKRTVSEIGRVLREGGLIFLVENTEPKSDTRHLRYRSSTEYQSLFPFARLEHAGEYLDLGERISILAGRKQRAEGSA